MSKKQKFIEFVEENLFSKVSEVDEEVLDYWNALKIVDEKMEKPVLTDNGKAVLKFMQTEMSSGKCRDIADRMMLSSRTVSGTMRKLISDGFVEKIGTEPIVYCITTKGKELIIEN